MNNLIYTNLDSFKSSYLDSIYNSLKLKQNQSNKTVNLTSIFQSIPSVLKEFHISTSYFDTYLEYFIYETLFDIYHDATSTLSFKNPSSVNLHAYIYEKHPAAKGDKDLSHIIESKISSQKKKLFKAISIFTKTTNITSVANSIPSHFKSKKAYDFYSFFQKIQNKNKNKFVSLLPLSNLLFNLEDFNKFIYTPDNIDSGIQYYNFIKSVCDFIEYHPSKTYPLTFEDEYSAYLFEQLHYPIQFQKCVLSYSLQKFASKEYQEAYFPLFLYTKLFDTHYLSLTDYILNKYGAIPISNPKAKPTEPSIYTIFYDTTEEAELLRFSSFYEMQFYNTAILPLLTYIIKKLLFDLNNGDIELIQKQSYEQLLNILNDNNNIKERNQKPFSYFKQLTQLHEKSKVSNYPGYNKIPLTNERLKNTAPEYIFNHHISLAFYTKDIPDFFHLNMPFYNWNGIQKSLTDFYSVSKDFYGNSTLSEIKQKENLSLL